MDPFTALGIAGNILQFVDFTSKLLSQAEEIRHAGNTASSLELANTTRDFEILARKLATPSSPETLSCLTQDDQAVHDMARDCARLATGLSLALKKVSGRPGQSAWRTFRQTLLTVCTEKQIATLSRRLDLYRQQLQFRMMVMMKQNIDLLTVAEEQRMADAGATEHTIVNAIVNNSATITSSLYDAAMELRGKIDQYAVRAEERHQETITTINQNLSATNNFLDTPDDLPEVRQDSQAHRYTAEIICYLKDSLRFERMNYREEDIVVAHQDTFRWALRNDWEDSCVWSNFMTWLSEGNGYYWFNGKAGSGNSTLMKFIIESTHTQDALRIWAGTNCRLIIASFYLWRSGSGMQKNPTGLFRKVLSEVLAQCPDLAHDLFPEYIRAALRVIQASLRKGNFQNHEMWRYLQDPPDMDVRRAFEKLMNSGMPNTRLCLFIDGIDELDGDVEDLLRLLLSAKSPSVKIAASSRPISECEEAFENWPKLRLQDLTQNDMLNYVSSMFSRHPRTRELDVLTMEKLKYDIVERASGVFLWTVLVVKSLIKGFRNYDTIPELRARLDEYPPELDDLYRHMIQGMNPFYREQASQLLQIFCTAHTQGDMLSAVELYWANVPSPTESIIAPVRVIPDGQLVAYRKMMDARLRSRCCGLLEIDNRGDVAFLHRTVLDFLRDHQVWADLLTLSIDADFVPYVSILSSTLAMVKIATPLVGVSITPVLNQPRPDAENFKVVMKCLKYNMLAERSTQKSQANYLEALDIAMTTHWHTHDLIPLAESWTPLVSWKFPNLLSLAVARNLCFYVRDHLAANPDRVRGRYGQDLLLTAVQESERGSAVFGDQIWSRKSHVQMFIILLRAGADPFAEGEYGCSVWVYVRDNRIKAFEDAIVENCQESMS